MTKVLTYPSFGGYIPDVVSDYLERHPDADIHTDAGLIELVESFRGNPMCEELMAWPDKLFYHKTTKGADGITRTLFAGYSTPNQVRREGHVCTVSVNEFDGDKIKTIIVEYEGSQTLNRLPEYAPVPGVPGLYRQINEESEEYAPWQASGKKSAPNADTTGSV